MTLRVYVIGTCLNSKSSLAGDHTIILDSDKVMPIVGLESEQRLPGSNPLFSGQVRFHICCANQEF